MDLSKIKKADFAARDPDIPLFWRTLWDHTTGDYVALTKQNVSEYYYLNGSEEIESEQGYADFRQTNKVKETIVRFDNVSREIAEFNEEIKNIKINEFSHIELWGLLQKIISKLSALAEVYITTEAARLRKIEQTVYNFLEQKIKDKERVKETFSLLVSHEKDQEGLDNEKLELLKGLQAGEEINTLIFAISNLAFLRFELKKKYIAISPMIRFIFTEIGSKIGMKEEIYVMKLSEIKDILINEANPKKDIYTERLNGYAVLKLNGNKYILSGKRFEELSNHIHDLTVKKDTSEISGQSARPGRCIGRIRKIVDYKREMKGFIERFKSGDIIVTGMTQPDIALLASKAGAIITDEGGVICHAAIISRELGIPCIVGTKIATKILENGDIVEVDADKGVIRKATPEQVQELLEKTLNSGL